MSGGRKLWARVVNGVVAEPPIWLELPIEQCFHVDAAATFVEATNQPDVKERWTYDGAKFSPPPPPTQAQQFQTAVRVLQQITAQQKQAGVWFTPQGYTAPLLFATDSTSQAELTGAFQLASVGLWQDGSCVFTAAGKPIPVTAADVIKLAKAAGSYVLGCNNYAARLIGLLEADPTTDISQGWPSNNTPTPPAVAALVVDVAGAVFTNNPNPPAQ